MKPFNAGSLSACTSFAIYPPYDSVPLRRNIPTDGQFFCRESGGLPRPRAHSSDTRRTGRSRPWAEGPGGGFGREGGEPSQLTEGRLRSRDEEEQLQLERQHRQQQRQKQGAQAQRNNGSLQNGSATAVASPPRTSTAAPVVTSSASAPSQARPALEAQISAPAGVSTDSPAVISGARTPVVRSSSLGPGPGRDHSDMAVIEVELLPPSILPQGHQGHGGDQPSNGTMPSKKSHSTSHLSAGGKHGLCLFPVEEPTGN